MKSPALGVWSAMRDASTPQLHDEVHVWRFKLDADAAATESLSQWLSPDEHARKERYLFDRDRHRFIVCRGKQRAILGRYANQSPSALRFHYSDRGKPTLHQPKESQPMIHFNVSNSKDMGLCAVANHPVLGVDVEKIREMNDMLGLAERFFAASESEELRRESADRRMEAFFSIWTCKEAILKAVGKGIAFPLNKVVISNPPRRIVQFGDIDDAGSWQLQRLAPGVGYVGALAGQFPARPIRCWDFDLGHFEQSG